MLANPEIAGLPAGRRTDCGGRSGCAVDGCRLLLVISTSISHDLLKSNLMPHISEKQELLAASRSRQRLQSGLLVILGSIPACGPGGGVCLGLAVASSSRRSSWAYSTSA